MTKKEQCLHIQANNTSNWYTEELTNAILNGIVIVPVDMLTDLHYMSVN